MYIFGLPSYVDYFCIWVPWIDFFLKKGSCLGCFWYQIVPDGNNNTKILLSDLMENKLKGYHFEDVQLFGLPVHTETDLIAIPIRKWGLHNYLLFRDLLLPSLLLFMSFWLLLISLQLCFSVLSSIFFISSCLEDFQSSVLVIYFSMFFHVCPIHLCAHFIISCHKTWLTLD